MGNKLLLVIIILCLFACNKHDASTKYSRTDTVSLKTIKSNIIYWMDAQKQKNDHSNNFVDTLKKEALWDSITLNSISQNESFIYIPINYNSNKTALVFILNNKDLSIEEGFISEISYDKTLLHQSETIDLKPCKLINDFYKYKKNDFNGSMSAYSITNKFIWEMGYKKGSNIYMKKIMKGLPPSIKKQSVTNKSETTQPTTNSCTAYYLLTYWSDGTVDYEYIGGSCDDGCDLSRAINRNSSSLISMNCGGGGGGGGSGSDPSSPNTITNNIVNQCLKNTVQRITNSNLQNAITDILGNVFGVSSSVNLIFEQSDLYNHEGHTSGYCDGTGLIRETVYLNPNLLSEASQEYDASIVIHEIIHCALNVKDVAVSLQHPEILKNYIDKMSTSLMGFYPNLTLQEARSMSLQGLGDVVESSTAFDELLQQYGFNRDFQSSNNFSFYSKQFAVGTLGTSCDTGNGQPLN